MTTKAYGNECSLYGPHAPSRKSLQTDCTRLVLDVTPRWKKRDTNTGYQKRAQTDWQRFSDVPVNTCCSAHSQEIFYAHKIYIRSKTFFSSVDWKRLNERGGGKKKLYLTTALCFSTFIVLFFFFVSFCGSLGDGEPSRFSLSESLTVRSLSRCPSQWDRDSCSPPIRPPTELHLWFPGTTAPGGWTCEGRSP